MMVCTIISHSLDPFLPFAESYYGRYMKTRVIIGDEHDSYEQFLSWHRLTAEDAMSDGIQRSGLGLVVDADDILVPCPRRYRDLAHYIREFLARESLYSTAVAYEVFDLSAAPDPYTQELDVSINFEEPLLKQRRRWLRSESYDKTLLSKVALRYGDLHDLQSHQKCTDGDLYMIHLGRIDYGICKLRHAIFAKDKKLRDEHHWNLDGGKYRHWFYQMDTDILQRLEAIPEHMMAAL